MKQDISARWNSTFIMLGMLVQIKEALSAAISHLLNAPTFSDASKWDATSYSILLLKPHDTMANLLSGDLTMSNTIPFTREIQYTIESSAPGTELGLWL